MYGLANTSFYVNLMNIFFREVLMRMTGIEMVLCIPLVELGMLENDKCIEITRNSGHPNGLN